MGELEALMNTFTVIAFFKSTHFDRIVIIIKPLKESAICMLLCEC